MLLHSGFVTRTQRIVGPNVRIEIVTDGVLLRRLQADPTLPGVGAVLIDEFHERGMMVRCHCAVIRLHGFGAVDPSMQW